MGFYRVLLPQLGINDAVELVAIQKIHKLRENEFGIVHLLFLYETAKIQNQIRSLLKTLQRTKYQLFQRTLSVFNGTVMRQSYKSFFRM